MCKFLSYLKKQLYLANKCFPEFVMKIKVDNMWSFLCSYLQAQCPKWTSLLLVTLLYHLSLTVNYDSLWLSECRESDSVVKMSRLDQKSCSLGLAFWNTHSGMLPLRKLDQCNKAQATCSQWRYCWNSSQLLNHEPPVLWISSLRSPIQLSIILTENQLAFDCNYVRCPK